MAEGHATSEELIPSYVRARNAVAEKAGIEVGVCVQEGEILSTWIGSAAQVNSCAMRIENSWAFRPSAKRGRIRSPFFYVRDAHRECDDSFSLLIQDDMPTAHRRWRDIDVYEMQPNSCESSKCWYHASPEALIRAALIKEGQVPRGQAKGRFIKSRSGRVKDDYWWETHLCFDGSVLFKKGMISEGTKQHWRMREQQENRQAGVEEQEQRLQRTMQTRATDAARNNPEFLRFMARVNGRS